MPVLINALDGTMYYVGSYARDARFKLSKAVKHLSTMAAASAGRKRRPWSTTIIGLHIACISGAWGTLSAKGSVAGGVFCGAIAVQLGTLA